LGKGEGISPDGGESRETECHWRRYWEAKMAREKGLECPWSGVGGGGGGAWGGKAARKESSESLCGRGNTAMIRGDGKKMQYTRVCTRKKRINGERKGFNSNLERTRFAARDLLYTDGVKRGHKEES